jgi:signal transduction histidine kinase
MAERYFDYQLSSYELREQVLRIILLPIVGFLTWQLAEANRTEARRAQSVAGELAQANRNLQAAEAAVRRSERLAALGQLTAGLAHELRNPMGTMKASAEMLAKQVGSKSPVVAELAGYICSEVDRTNSLITRFLEFARPMKLRRSRADLNELIDQTVPRLERGLAKHGVHLVKNPAPDLRPLDMDAELMERVLANLITNAVQASSSGGTVTVKTGNVPGGVEVAVIDRGSGIKPEEMEQIFNPFYTTKKDGVGLGLAIVSKIVDEHGGRIHVDSEPGQGTQFAVFLPTQVSDSGTSGVRS